MTYRYVTQRDLDGTWSVREVGTKCRAIYRGKVLAGLSEKVAALSAKKLNDRSGPDEGPVDSVVDCPPLVSGIQQTIDNPLPLSLKDA
jgi:hypothetical protein